MSSRADRRVRILCFGDSNTWGYSPKDGSRYPRDVRWTGVLQGLLGEGHEIIEEGLNGRTSAFDYKDRFGKNGRDYLRPCLDSHFPLDFVILCLGTNDTKVEFGLTAERIAAGLEELIQIVLGKGLERASPGVKLIVAAPALVSDAHLGDYASVMGGAEEKTKQFPRLYGELARKYGAAFVDLSREAPPSPLDGCHLSPESHVRVAELFFAKIRELDPGRR